MASYTSQRMLDQQALTLAEVLAGDPSTRFTGQVGGVTDSFFICGFPLNEGNLSEVAFEGVYLRAGRCRRYRRGRTAVGAEAVGLHLVERGGCRYA